MGTRGFRASSGGSSVYLCPEDRGRWRTGRTCHLEDSWVGSERSPRACCRPGPKAVALQLPDRWGQTAGNLADPGVPEAGQSPCPEPPPETEQSWQDTTYVMANLLWPCPSS